MFQALREEQNEAAMAMSSTTLGEDDGSVDTADTPTTIGSRNSRPRSHRVGSNVSPAAAAAAAAAGPDGEGCVRSGSRRRKTPSRSRAAAAAAGEGAPPEDGKETTASPVMPTPPRSEVKVDTLLVRVKTRWASGEFCGGGGERFCLFSVQGERYFVEVCVLTAERLRQWPSQHRGQLLLLCVDFSSHKGRNALSMYICRLCLLACVCKR